MGVEPRASSKPGRCCALDLYVPQSPELSRLAFNSLFYGGGLELVISCLSLPNSWIYRPVSPGLVELFIRRSLQGIVVRKLGVGLSVVQTFPPSAGG